jgi:hypothetical protein
MKSIALSTFALSFVLLAASGISAAADEKKPAKPAAGAAAAPAPGGPIKLTRSVMAKAPAVPSTVSRTTDTASYDPATKALEKWKAAGLKYGEAGLAYRNKRDKECPAKEYTAADQTAAGCTASDALPACSAKVYERCWAASYKEWVDAQKAFFDAKVALDTALHGYMTQVGVRGATR